MLSFRQIPVLGTAILVLVFFGTQACKSLNTASKTADSPTPCASYSLPPQNLLVWLKADSIGSVSDGDLIGQWNDSSTNGLHFSQTDSAKRPVYKTNVINGQPALHFDGIDDILEGVSTGQISLSASNAWEIQVQIIYANYTQSGSGTNDNAILNFVIGGATSGLRMSIEGSTNKGVVTARSVSTDSANRIVGSIATPSTNPKLFNTMVTFLDRGNAFLFLSTSGIPGDPNEAVAGLTPTFLSGHWTQSTATLKDSIGGDLSSATASFSGDIAEIIVYRNPTPYTNNCEDAAKYLSEKYGL